jgi:hypothetical protein
MLRHPVAGCSEMAFACTFFGLLLALVIWAALYTIASNSQIAWLVRLAPHLEAFSLGGWCTFAVLSIVISLLAYRILRDKR